MPKNLDFEKEGCQVGEKKKFEEKSDLHSRFSLSGRSGRCYTG